MRTLAPCPAPSFELGPTAQRPHHDRGCGVFPRCASLSAKSPAKAGTISPVRWRGHHRVVVAFKAPVMHSGGFPAANDSRAQATAAIALIGRRDSDSPQSLAGEFLLATIPPRNMRMWNSCRSRRFCRSRQRQAASCTSMIALCKTLPWHLVSACTRACWRSRPRSNNSPAATALRRCPPAWHSDAKWIYRRATAHCRARCAPDAQ